MMDGREALRARIAARPARMPLLSRTQWSAFLLFTALLAAGVPMLNQWATPDSAWYLPDHIVSLFGKILCLAIAALAMDLVWGYTGILSLGHGIFFALGGYAIGMHLMRMSTPDTRTLPAFMSFLDWKELPWFWQLTEHFAWSAMLVVLVPGLLAFVFGWLTFRSRIRGVYFSIISQALTYAAMLLFFRNETGFGGNNGFTGFGTLLGMPLNHPHTRLVLYIATAIALALAFLACRWIVSSRYGRVLTAIRDAESRVMFCGYDPVRYKLSIWVIPAVLCAIAGALYVPQVGIINPGEMSPAASIEIAIWTAVGGRATLVGPIVGAIAVNGAKSWFTLQLAEYWLYVLGGLFIVVTLFLPDGLFGLARSLRRAIARRARRAREPKVVTKGAKQARNDAPSAAGISTVEATR